MDPRQEKKWFVYLGDHHEGPFSVEEIEAKVSSGQASTSHFVWCEGMGDWKVMTEVPAFTSPSTPEVPHLDMGSLDQSSGLGMGGPSQDSLVMQPLQAEAHTDHSIATKTWSGRAAETHEPTGVILGAQAAPAEDDFSHLDPKERKKAEKEAKKRAKEEAKRKAAEEKERKKQEKKNKGKKSDPLAYGADQTMSIRGENKGSLRKTATILFAIVLIFFAGVEGYLDPVLQPLLNNPQVKPYADQLKGQVKPMIMDLLGKVPGLQDWLSPIPQLQDVGELEIADLKKAASVSSDPDAPRAAIALSILDSTSPTFYVSTSLPDGVLFDLYLVGTPGTLMNRLEFVTNATLTITNHFGKTEPIKSADASAIPAGEYEVYLVEATQQPQPVQAALEALPQSATRPPPMVSGTKKLVVKKSFFLGGKKDASYLSRLKAYHTKLTEKAHAEMDEVKQFASTLISQYNDSLTKYEALKKSGFTGPKKKDWLAFHGKWEGFSKTLNEGFEKWTPEALNKDYYHTRLYEILKTTGIAVNKMHVLQHSYFTEKVDKKAVEDQIAEAINQSKNSLNDLKTKIQQLEQAAPGPGGIPARLGL